MELDEKTLIDKYLHGELEDQEREVLEERFFADDDLYEQIETAEMLLIDRFVRGGMDPEETARFRAGYLTSPERQRKVARTALFFRELHKLKGERKGWLSGLASLFDLRIPVLQFASVATLIILSIGIIWTVILFQSSVENVDLGNINGDIPPVNTDTQSPLPVTPDPANTRPQSTPGEALPSPTPRIPATPDSRMPPGRGDIPTNRLEGIVAVILEPGMSGGVPRSVPVRIGARTVFLRLDLPLPDEIKGESFSISIVDHAGRRVSTSEAVRPRRKEGGRILSVSLAADKLGNGRHDVTVRPEGGASDQVKYRFDVRRED